MNELETPVDSICLGAGCRCARPCPRRANPEGGRRPAWSESPPSTAALAAKLCAMRYPRSGFQKARSYLTGRKGLKNVYCTDQRQVACLREFYPSCWGWEARMILLSLQAVILDYICVKWHSLTGPGPCAVYAFMQWYSPSGWLKDPLFK